MSPDDRHPVHAAGDRTAPTMMLFGSLGSTTRSDGLPLVSVSLTAKSPLPRSTTSILLARFAAGDCSGSDQRRAEDLRVVRVGDVQDRQGEVAVEDRSSPLIGDRAGSSRRCCRPPGRGCRGRRRPRARPCPGCPGTRPPTASRGSAMLTTSRLPGSVRHVLPPEVELGQVGEAVVDQHAAVTAKSPPVSVAVGLGPWLLNSTSASAGCVGLLRSIERRSPELVDRCPGRSLVEDTIGRDEGGRCPCC